LNTGQRNVINLAVVWSSVNRPRPGTTDVGCSANRSASSLGYFIGRKEGRGGLTARARRKVFDFVVPATRIAAYAEVCNRRHPHRTAKFQVPSVARAGGGEA